MFVYVASDWELQVIALLEHHRKATHGLHHKTSHSHCPTQRTESALLLPTFKLMLTRLVMEKVASLTFLCDL